MSQTPTAALRTNTPQLRHRPRVGQVSQPRSYTASEQKPTQQDPSDTARPGDTARTPVVRCTYATSSWV